MTSSSEPSASVPPSLTDPGLDPLWRVVRERLERQGVDNRGVVAVPELGVDGRHTVRDLVGATRPVRRVDLFVVEEALRRLAVGADLPSALAALGHPVSDEPAQRREARRVGRDARSAAREAAASWPEPWATAWIDEVVRAGVLRDRTEGEARDLVDDVRRLLDDLPVRAGRDPGPVARVDLAAQVIGDAHALDRGTRLEVALGRALAHVVGDPGNGDPWAAAGVDRDLTAGPVLTWALPLTGALGGICDAATAAGVPVHLTRLAVDAHPVTVRAGSRILVVENPRVVESAAQIGAAGPMISANGSPSTTVQVLVRRLLDAGATLRYHGDFDAAGLVLCARMADLGVEPWRMTSVDYLAAVAHADATGVALPADADGAPSTPWDPSLRSVFDDRRLVVHEERLLPDLVTAW